MVEEIDAHSKVSTACTNEEQRAQYKLKVGSGTDSKKKRQGTMKVKKSSKAPKIIGEGLDEETKSILDN